MRSLLEDARDLIELRRAVLDDDGGPGFSLDEVKARLGLTRSKNGTRRKPKRRS